jgi:membrane protein implicated in regulation of membrane protease activity
VQQLFGQLHWLWLALSLVFAIAEMMAPSFGFFFAAVAALVAALAAALHASWEAQLGIFGVALIGFLLGLRPMVLRKLKARSVGVPSRTAVLVGKQGQVTQASDPASGIGRARVNGQDWAIRSEEKLETGSLVQVEGADGIILIVRKV